MPNVPESHARHDPLDPVALAAGDLTGAERVRAIALIAACGDCARLHDDVLAIARATAAIPPVARSREFTISPEQAARLRPAGWRRFFAAFASPQLAVSRQLGVAMTTIGLAGLLVSVLPTMQIGFGGSAAAPVGRSATQQETSRQSYAAAAAPSSSPELLSGVGGYTDTAGPAKPSSAPVRAVAGDGSMSLASGPIETTEKPAFAQPNNDTAGGGSDQAVGDGAPPSQPVSIVLIASAVLLVAGIALLIARRLSRKLTTG
jgi:hypothetical protein